MLHLTPAMLENAYELLRTTPPFRRWKLPHADEVVFRVTNSHDVRGTFQKSPHLTIEISAFCTINLKSLIEVMAHEMVHLHEDTNHGARADVDHSAAFKRFSKQVCKAHNFDERLF